MPHRVNGVKYPDTVVEILKDRELGKAFRSHVKAGLAYENIEFLDAAARPNIKRIYKKFFENPAKRLNIGHVLTNPAVDLAQQGRWNDTAAWAVVLRNAKREVLKVLDQNFMYAFFTSDAFQKIHGRRLKATIKVPPPVKKELGLKEADLLAVIVEYKLDKTAGARSAQGLARKKKLNSLQTKLLTDLLKRS